jgi:hypothetical protein
MTGYHVEFVDDSGPARAGEVTETAPAAVPRRALVASSCWLLTAACCVLASFQTVYTYHFTGRNITSRGGYDAWGHALDSALNDSSGPRYAIVLWLCAAVSAVLAATSVRAGSTGGRWVQRHAAQVGIGVAGVLAGVLASIALDIQAGFGSYRALADSLNDQGGVDLGIGWCLWFGLAALAGAVAAVAFALRRAR